MRHSANRRAAGEGDAPSDRGLPIAIDLLYDEKPDAIITRERSFVLLGGPLAVVAIPFGMITALSRDHPVFQ